MMDSPATSAPAPRPTAPRRRPSAAPSALTRTMLNFWLDTLLLAVFLLLIWSSTIIRFVFPPAVNARDWTLWSWDVDHWIGFQYATLALFSFLVLVHVMLHWTWVCGVLAARLWRDKDGKKATLDDGVRTLIGVGFLIALLCVLGTGMAAAMFMVQGPN